MTRDRARKKSVRAQMAASGEPYSIAARKLGKTGAAAQAARDEVITRVEATLAAASARIEVRKVVTAGPATGPARDRHRRGPFRRLAGVAVRAGWDHAVPEQARILLRTAFADSAMGIIEPSARRFQYVVFKQHYSALAQMALGLDVGPAPSAYSAYSSPREDPLELLMRLRPVTAARYAGEETVREARCRKIAVTVGGSPAVLTVWVDDEHVRQIQAVTSKKAKRIAVTVVATTMVTAQLWDFGVPVDSMDWRRPSALWSKLARRPARTRPGRRRAIPNRGAQNAQIGTVRILDRRRACPDPDWADLLRTCHRRRLRSAISVRPPLRPSGSSTSRLGAGRPGPGRAALNELSGPLITIRGIPRHGR